MAQRWKDWLAQAEHYGPLQSDQGLSYAGDILGFVHQALADR